MAETKIEWADKVWNPVTGCTKVSAGCKNCYAEKMTKRLRGMGQANYQAGFGTVVCHDNMLEKPLHWKKPRRIFVNSMSDLFHEDVPFEFIDRVFAVMALCPQHTFIILSKRPDRMKEYLDMLVDERDMQRWVNGAYAIGINTDGEWDWPLPNVQLGVSVEDQATADKRIPLLLQTPAATRIVSYEPALGAVNFKFNDELPDPDGCYEDARHNIQQIITGGESGPGYRPMDLKWARDVRDQCKAAGVAFYFKQTAGKGEIPKDLQIREMP